MAVTSARSGANYRNWWRHPLMADFTNRAITLMEDIACATANRISMTRRGYIPCSRNADIQLMINDLAFSRSAQAGSHIRRHDNAIASGYTRADKPDWQTAPAGFDVLNGGALIRSCFPSRDPSVQALLHIRRGGKFPVNSLVR